MPITPRPVLPSVLASAEKLGRVLESRCGGPSIVRKARERLQAVPDVVDAHTDDRALERAADSAARALHFVECSIVEHADAERSDVALDRARTLLTEALLALEACASVNYHAEAIRAVREG